jgi:hypothetical protein
VGSIIRRYSPFSNFLKVRDDLLLEEIHMDSTEPPAAPTALYINAASPAAKPLSSTPSRPPNGRNDGIGGNRNKNNNKNRNSGNGGGNNGKNSNRRSWWLFWPDHRPHWFRRQDQRIVADLRPPVVGTHDYVPRPRAHWTAASAGLRGHTGPLRVSRPPIRATAATVAVPVGHPGPRMEPLTRRKLGPAVAGQLV